MSKTLLSTRTVLIALLALASAALLAARARAGGPEGPVRLFNGKNLDGWKMRNDKADPTWKVVSSVELDKADPKKLVGAGEGGTDEAILFRSPVAHGTDIITEKTFGDCELHLDLMVPKGANSGVYLMGEYELQVLDSAGKPDGQLTAGDMGGIYALKAPSTNAAKPAGEWQTFDIVFRAPRFDAAGKKTENARFVSVTLNGKKIQDNLEVPRPTGGELGPEKPTGPLMLQGDHGIVAFRNITLKPLDLK